MQYSAAPKDNLNDQDEYQQPAEEHHAVYRPDLRRDILQLYGRLHIAEDEDAACATVSVCSGYGFWRFPLSVIAECYSTNRAT